MITNEQFKECFEEAIEFYQDLKKNFETWDKSKKDWYALTKVWRDAPDETFEIEPAQLNAWEKMEESYHLSSYPWYKYYFVWHELLENWDKVSDEQPEENKSLFQKAQKAYEECKFAQIKSQEELELDHLRANCRKARKKWREEIKTYQEAKFEFELKYKTQFIES